LRKSRSLLARSGRRVALRTGAAALLATAALAAQLSPPGVDAAFAQFFAARTPDEQAAAIGRVVATGIGVDEAAQRLRNGRAYGRDVARGTVDGSHRTADTEYFYTLDVPQRYDPAHRYQVRIQLHGGVGRIGSNVPPRAASAARLTGAEQIYILPYAWRDAPWWSRPQLENLRAILDTVKRTYNVDENRVVVAGVSDGGTGAYYIAMRDTTPYASFLPLNGFIMVLPSVDAGDLYPNNLRNKPFFVVNGGRDPLYPTRTVEPYVNHLKTHGVVLEYHPQPNAVHNTAWWPDVVDSFETFVSSHPRNPLPDKLTWQSSATRLDNRAHWLIIDKLAPRTTTREAPLEDLNRFGDVGQLMFENTDQNGRVDLVRTGNTVKATTRGVAEFTLLLSPDAFDFSKPVRIETNGNVAFEGSVTKSVETLSTWAARDNDRTMLFGAELHIRVR